MAEYKKEFIIFDLDGTLTDSGPGVKKCAQYALESFGILEEDEERLNMFIGPPLMDSFMERYGFSEKDARKAVEKYRERYNPIGIYENSLYEGIDETLNILKDKGFKLGIATSKPKVMTDVVLDYFNIAKYFDVVVGADLVGGLQHKGEILKVAIEKSECKQNRIVMIGDRKYDCVGAKENGVDCIGVTYGYGSREELIEAGATWICDTPKEIVYYVLG